ncbi:MAG: hypothetical protein Kow00121_30910 [Elainellaceae cyanobacterium]
MLKVPNLMGTLYSESGNSGRSEARNSGTNYRGAWAKFNQGFAWVSDRFLRLVQYFIQIRYVILGLFVTGLPATVYI